MLLGTYKMLHESAPIQTVSEHYYSILNQKWTIVNGFKVLTLGMFANDWQFHVKLKSYVKKNPGRCVWLQKVSLRGSSQDRNTQHLTYNNLWNEVLVNSCILQIQQIESNFSIPVKSCFWLPDIWTSTHVYSPFNSVGIHWLLRELSACLAAINVNAPLYPLLN